MKLHAWLEFARIGVPDFAKMLGVSYRAAWHYIRGERVPSPRAMKRIAIVTKGAVLPNDFYELNEDTDIDLQREVDSFIENRRCGVRAAPPRKQMFGIVA